jgi:plasmid maintenance system antidote protein VapI
MNITKRQPVGVGEMITEEFLVPLTLTQGQLAEAMGVSRKTVNESNTTR